MIVALIFFFWKSPKIQSRFKKHEIELMWPNENNIIHLRSLVPRPLPMLRIHVETDRGDWGRG